jgi:outer membrane biosynthesis protein TonB
MMRQGSLFSALLHLSVILLAYFGLPHLMPVTPEPEIPIPVDVVTLSDKTSLPKTLPKPEPPKLQAQLPQAPPLPAPPQKQTPQKPEPQQAALVPPTPEPVPQQKQKPLPEKKPEPEPKPIVQEAPRAKPKPPPQESLDTILKNVEKMKPKSQPDPADKVIKELAQVQPRPTSSLDNLATISLKDEARRQIERCWNVPAGAKDAKDLVVEIHAMFNPDGTVREATIVDQARENTDTFYRAAAESARRAVFTCQPLKLPPEKYSDWQEITFSFDPSQML